MENGGFQPRVVEEATEVAEKLSAAQPERSWKKLGHERRFHIVLSNLLLPSSLFAYYPSK